MGVKPMMVFGDLEGKPIHVSASDVERFVYCPMSWRLSQEGVPAKGEEVRRGIEEHERLHMMIVERNQAREQFTKNLVIWSWWFSVVIYSRCRYSSVLFRSRRNN